MKKIFLILILVILSVISIFIGVNNISVTGLLNLDNNQIHVLLVSRIPRLVAILVAGVGMSIAGLIMQGISNNKFVSPTTSATIDSAKLGVLISTIFFVQASLVERMLISFVFSIIGTFIFMKIMKKVKFKEVIYMPLVGLMLGGVIGAITDFIGYKMNMVQSMTSFMQGNFSKVIQGNYEFIILTIPLLIVAGIYANKFTLIGMGKDVSVNLGVDFEKILNIGVILVALITSIVVVTVGSIPFVGLIIPNIVSIKYGDNIKNNGFYVGILGAIFILICDILGRVIIFPYEIPINLIVGIIGSIIFLYLIFRSK